MEYNEQMAGSYGKVIVTPDNNMYIVSKDFIIPSNPNEPGSIIRWHKFDYTGCRFATEEETKKFHEELNSNGYVWNISTVTQIQTPMNLLFAKAKYLNEKKKEWDEVNKDIETILERWFYAHESELREEYGDNVYWNGDWAYFDEWAGIRLPFLVGFGDGSRWEYILVFPDGHLGKCKNLLKHYIGMNTEEKVLPYDVCMTLKNLDYNEYCEYMYETVRLHNGEELGTDEEFELKCEGKPYTIEYIPGGRLNCYNVKNDFDWLSVENCGAPYIEDVICWLEKEHNILVVTMPRLVTEHMAETDYQFDVTFEGHWMVNVYYVGRTLASNDSVRLADDINPNNNYTSYDSRIKAEIDGIRQALEFINKLS